jgi:hypothetical protein
MDRCSVDFARVINGIIPEMSGAFSGIVRDSGAQRFWTPPVVCYAFRGEG